MNMSQLKPIIIVLLMLTSALAGCTGTDTTDLEQQIEDLQQSNDEMEVTISQKNNEISLLQEFYEDSISDVEVERNSLLEQLEDTETSLDEINSMIEAANSLILTLQSDLVLQQDLVVQWQQTAEDNRADLSYISIMNGAYLGNADLSNADLSNAYLIDVDLEYANLTGADLTDIYWYNTICPDGTNSNDNGNTCENNL